MSGTAANIALGANYISYAGTDAGFSLDASNNATLSGNLIAGGTVRATAATGVEALFIYSTGQRGSFIPDDTKGLIAVGGSNNSGGFVVQTIVTGSALDRLTVANDGTLTIAQNLTVSGLAGTGTRAVVVDANGVMSAP